jgi:PadR family transcriptional regulator PadR
MTMVVMEILDLLMNAPPDDPAWGLKICEQTGRGSGTTYPALDRMMKAHLIEDRWEAEPPEDRPRRRYYMITAAGRAAYLEELSSREARRMAWVRPAFGTGRAV